MVLIWFKSSSDFEFSFALDQFMLRRSKGWKQNFEISLEKSQVESDQNHQNVGSTP